MIVLSIYCNATATTEIYTLSLHDALPISLRGRDRHGHLLRRVADEDPHPLQHRGGHQGPRGAPVHAALGRRSEEHTSELQSLTNLVCRLLLEKKKKTLFIHIGEQVYSTMN